MSNKDSGSFRRDSPEEGQRGATTAHLSRSALLLSLVLPFRNGRILRLIDTLTEKGFAATIIAPFETGSKPAIKYLTIGKKDGYSSFFWSVRRVFTRVTILLASWFNLDLLAVSDWLARKALGFSKYVRDIHNESDLIVVEDILLLGLALRHKNGARIVYEARDYAHVLFNNNRLWSLTIGRGLKALLVQAVPLCDEVITVSDELAGSFNRDFGIETVVVRSVPDRSTISWKAPGVGELLKLVYLGRADSNRGLDQIIATVGALGDKFTLDLFLVGHWRDRSRLTKQCQSLPHVNIRRPVPFDQIIPTLSRYDMGLALFPPLTENLQHSLPNKFFEYLYAGLPVIAGESSTMAAIVDEYHCGFIFSTGKKSLMRLFDGISRDEIVALGDGVSRLQHSFKWESEKARLAKALTGESRGGARPKCH